MFSINIFSGYITDVIFMAILMLTKQDTERWTAIAGHQKQKNPALFSLNSVPPTEKLLVSYSILKLQTRLIIKHASYRKENFHISFKTEVYIKDSLEQRIYNPWSAVMFPHWEGIIRTYWDVGTRFFFPIMSVYNIFLLHRLLH